MSRRIELDVLRGVLLLLMALTHLPTRASAYADQPLGFVSTAEGFVFLSAFVASCTYTRLLRERGAREVRRRLWTRAAKLYGCHLALLLFAFTIAAGIAVMTGRPGLRNLLSLYFAEPGWALLAAPLFLYQPPLLDILPMYVAFLALTPWVLEIAREEGWSRLAFLSLLLWVFAQLGGRGLLYQGFCLASGWPLPIESLGAFDWFAWQLLWIAGLWAGARWAEPASVGAGTPHRRHALTMALVTGLLFLLWRHRFGGLWIDLGAAFSLLDKWHLGLLRLINFAALAILVSRLVLPYAARLRMAFLALLGRASLSAFTAHLLVCLLSLGLIVDNVTPLTAAQQVCVLASALASMLFVAWRVEARRQGRSLRPPRTDSSALPTSAKAG